ncbi:aldo/keto reductase [Acidocella aquatica]|uniref:Aldo/keto reductase n=1 Tax=Acidocella aquatica TaxID=1922313 RepID=A0ABQ6A827_9PROT|nr:NADP(H)-dependent aldo-keto reductase [Acidocella aquatica]GLR66363.1 aldo/keto reductase [Acidocella aquatica]
MKYKILGRTGISVSEVCLGSMTWGQQNTEAQAHEQLGYALTQGINFIDTAEMYPVPPRAETQGRTEAYIGSWLAARGRRDDLVIATKVAGPAERNGIEYIRPAPVRLDERNIRAALEGSLRRLRTDYVDLYQLHWPDRRAPVFGQTQYVHAPAEYEVPIEETLASLARLVKEGKIRAIGLSNESAWGTMRFVQLAEAHGLPRAASIQNAYSLVNRTFEQGLSEIALREDVGLLPYSPLGGGTLSGKYAGGAKPPGARMTLFTRFTRYGSPQGVRAIDAYVALARAHGWDPAQMALAFCASRDFVTSTIIGATTMEQLKTDIAAFDLRLSEDLLAGIEAIHTQSPNPCP